jgi:holo-[acyl-carrier protein] synthase
MNAIAHGIDLVEVARIERLAHEHGDRFFDRCFSPRELEYARSSARINEHLAARFAAKEAVLKAIGTGWSNGIGWTDVEVERDEFGRPSIVLHGKACELATQQGIASWLISLSHTQTHALASVIALAK